MGVFRSVAGLALRPLVEGTCHLLGGDVAASAAKGVVEFLENRFRDHSQRLSQALHEANARAWKALELALTGDSFLERCQVRLARGEDVAFRQQVQQFLAAIPAEQLPLQREELRRQCLRELRQARQAKLFHETLTPRQLAEDASAFARFSDPQQLLRADQQAVARLGAELRQAGYPHLAQLLALGPGPSLLVVAVRYFLRRAIEEDTQLFQGLAFAQLEHLQQGQEQGFAALQQLLTQQGGRLETLLDDIQAVVVESHAAVLDVQQELLRQGQGHREVYEAVLALQRRFDLLQPEVRPRDSLSIRSDSERRLVKEVVARYRCLPEEGRRQLPALLNAVARLELAAGAFGEAEGDFAAAAALVSDPSAAAEAHLNAFRAALENRAWDKALRELLQAVRLDGPRRQPFPLDKYRPQRILGAGGFGVAFLCRHHPSNAPVVVKTLLDDELDRGVEQLFTEAQILGQFDHPGIVRLRDCAYTDAVARTRPYLVTDYFDGTTLEEYVQRHGPLPAEELLAVARQMVDALQAAHGRNILHRDVKPGNVLLRPEKGRLRVQLIDFGLAMPQEALRDTTRRSRTLAGASIAGTLDYAAPEQMGKFPGKELGPYSDVYGFGKTCCYALFGTAQPVLQHWRSVPQPLAELLSRCMDENPDDRPIHFAAVGRCLQRLAEGGLHPVLDAILDEPPLDELPVVEEPVPTLTRSAARRPPGSRSTRRREEVGRAPAPPPQPARGCGPWGCLLGGATLVTGLFALMLVLVAGKQLGSPAGGFPPPVGPAWPPAATNPADWKAAADDPEESRVYLSDLPEFDVGPVGQGWSFGKEGNLGDAFHNRITVGKQLARKGLSLHPPEQGYTGVKYRIAPADHLQTAVAINEDILIGPSGGIFFEVLGDGKSLWKSSPVEKPGQAQNCRVPLQEVEVLELRVYPASQSKSANFWAHAVWLDPYITRPKTSKPVEGAPPATGKTVPEGSKRDSPQHVPPTEKTPPAPRER